MGKGPAGKQALDSRLTWLYRAGAAAALAAGMLLLIAMVSLITALLPFGASSGWLPALQNNWLIAIFKLHAGTSGAQIGLLHGLDLPDIAILALVGVTMVGLYAALRRTSRFWSLIAAIQPFLGILLFLATKTAGRSAVMGAALVISLVMLRGNIFKKATAYFGIAASLFLLIGDFSAGSPPSAMIAALLGIAYVLFIIWFFWIAQGLFQLGQNKKG